MNEQDDGASVDGMRILILDDERQLLKLLANDLQQRGALVQAAPDGRRGLQMLFDSCCDVIVLDLHMPNMDGVAFLQEALNIWPWLAVVVMTGYDVSRDTAAELRNLKVTRLLQKPFEHTDLLRQIREAYDEQQGEAAENLVVPIARVQRQLQLLRLTTEPALREESLLDAMRSLSVQLAQALDFAVIGVCGMEPNQNAAIFNIREPVTAAFIGELKFFLAQRYCGLTGDDGSMELCIELSGLDLDEDGANHPASKFCVPIMSGSELQGFLILASPEDGEFSVSDVAFIYGVANHLSTVFAALNRMRSLAIHDPLTGLYNRLHLERELERMWSGSARYGRPMAVAIMDFDHFKMVNDTYGHQTGDQVLKEFADLLVDVSRTSDVVGRYGGEEFLVLLPDANREDARSYGKRLISKVREHVFCAGDHELHLTVSVGASAAEFSKLRSSNVHELVAEADQAMYAAKHAGRNCVRLWSPEERLTLEHQKPGEFTGEETLIGRPVVRGHILLVDDEPQIRLIMGEMLRMGHFEVATAASGEEALWMIEQKPATYDLVLADIQMPGMNGLELIEKAKAIDETLVCIIISGHASAENAIQGMRRGAYDFIKKPHITFSEVMPTIDRAIEYRKAVLENRQYQRHLSAMVRQKSASARDALREVAASYEFTLEALVSLLDARERSTSDHSKRVRALAIRMAEEIDWPEDEMKDLSYGALLHDIGKIGIPDHIMLKPGKLTPEEKEIMNQHAEIGYRVLSGSSYLAKAAEIVYCHQEAYDGSGYPRGLAGDAIPLGARLFSIIDSYDAMRTERVYRAALPEEVVVQEIFARSGTQFDPAMVNAFLCCRSALARIYDAWDSSHDAQPVHSR